MKPLVNYSLIALLLGTFILYSCQKASKIAPIPDDCLVRAASNNGKIIPEEYIITYKKNADPNKAARIAVSDIEATFEGENNLVIAHLEKRDFERIKSDPTIESIEPDRVMSICACVDVVAPRTLSWSVRKTGYGRIGTKSQKVAWIIDSGIDLDHPDLNVDNSLSRSFVTGQTSADDINGHGTHVAGIIGAKNNTVGLIGIASDVKMIALKVFNQLGEGRLSSVIQAVRHVNQNGKAGDVVNMSLGGEGVSTTLEREIQTAADKGILFSIAAGNEYEDVSGYSPARFNHPNVFTVSAVDSSNRFASFSNFGASVDVAAYGVRVISTYSNGRYATLSGTSMAAPHVAGLLLTRGVNIPKRGTALNDPDGRPDPIARE
jgi:subtilisin